MKKLTVYGKTNLIICVVTALVLLFTVVCVGESDREIVGMMSLPALILVPLGGCVCIPITKKLLKISEKIHKTMYKILYHIGVFLANILIAVLLSVCVDALGVVMYDNIMTGNTGIDGLGTALILAFLIRVAVLAMLFIAMLPQLQMILVAVLKKRERLT